MPKLAPNNKHVNDRQSDNKELILENQTEMSPSTWQADLQPKLSTCLSSKLDNMHMVKTKPESRFSGTHIILPPALLQQIINLLAYVAANVSARQPLVKYRNVV